MLLTQWRNTLWTSIKELFLQPKFDNSSPFGTRGKTDLSKSCNYEVMMSLSP